MQGAQKIAVNSSLPWAAKVDAAVAAFHEARYLEALDHYRAAYREAERGPLTAEWRGRLLRGIGACLVRLSDYTSGLEHYLKARAYTVEGGNREHLAILDSNIAAAYIHQGDLENGARIARRALRELERVPRSPQRAPILANIGVVELRRARPLRALAPLRAALAATRASGDRQLEAWVCDLLGLVELGGRDYQRAREWFERGLTVRRSLGVSANLTMSFLLLGRADLERGEPAAAMANLDRAVSLARQRDSRQHLWEGRYYRGRARWALGDREAAAADLQAAVEALDAISLKVIPTDGLRVQFEVAHHEVYAALAELLCEMEPTPAPRAFRAVEQGRTYSLRAFLKERAVRGHAAEDTTGRPSLWGRYHDSLARLEAAQSRAASKGTESTESSRLLTEQEAALRELEARLRLENPVSGIDVFAPAVNLTEAQRALDPNSLLLSFYVGAGNAASLWAVTDSEARFYHLPPPAHWKPLIHRFLGLLEEAASERRATGSALYQMLLGKVEPALLARRHWIVAADGELVSLPFCALPSPDGVRYLVEDHSFSYTPSASVLQILAAEGSRTYSHDFLGIADPVVNRADARWNGRPAPIEASERLSRVPASDAEVRACARLFGPGRSTVLTGFEASESTLRRLPLDSYRYWHFSSHIVVDSDHVGTSFIALSVPRQGSRLQKLTVFDIPGLPLRAEMVVLNGCDSGTGKNLPGAGLMGFVRAFLAAGAQSVCATRWKIPDESGAVMQRFYAFLDGRPSDRAEALRRAQIEMIRTGDWRSQPRYWAAYLLAGLHRSRDAPPEGSAGLAGPTRNSEWREGLLVAQPR